MLIPRIGILGAAISTVITQFISNVMLCFVIKDLRRSMIILTKSLNPKVLLNKMFEIRKCGRTK